MDINQTFRRNLRDAIEEAGTTPQRLSLLAGLNEKTVAAILKGRAASPKLSTVAALAEALGKDPAALMGLGTAVRVQDRLAVLLGQYSPEDQERLVSAIEALQFRPAEEPPEE